jgi:asparagine synthetase B (glutamine-hydrolysing)
MNQIGEAQQDRTSWLKLRAFAGRIENAAGLRAGSAPAGLDDGELLTALINSSGPAALSQLDGAFALVTERPDQRTTLLARDLLARRPLYWRLDLGQVRASPGLADLISPGEEEPDRAAVLEWLLYRQVLAPNTLYHGVHAVPQGACLELPCTSLVPESAFPAGFSDLISPELMKELSAASDSALIDRLERLLLAGLEHACAGRSRVGVLLSGGLDSTLVASLAREFADVTAFTMATGIGSELDESKRAQATASRLGIPIEVVAVDPTSYGRLAPAATRRLCLPLFHRRNIGFNVGYDQLLARAAEMGIDRVMTGDNAGPPFGANERTSALGWMLPMRRVMARLPGGVAPAIQKLMLDRAGLPVTVPEMPSGAAIALRMIDGGTRSRLMAGALEAFSFIRDERFRSVKAMSLVDMVAWVARFMERGSLLGDRYGIEVTTPFFHRPLLSFGLCLPERILRRSEGFLNRRRVIKWGLMQVAERRLGELAFFRQRAAWSAPMGRYVSPLAPLLLTEDGFYARHFRLGAADLVMERAGWRGDHNSLAKLIHLELWGRTCIMGEDPDELGQRLAAEVAKA